MSGKIKSNRKRRGLTPVISVIILSAVVIAVGGAVWSYAQGAATVIANNYVNDTLSLLYEVTERFYVEHVSNSSNGGTLNVWVYNYGEVDIVVDVYANSTWTNGTHTTYTFASNFSIAITAGELVNINVDFSGNPLQPGDMISVKVHSRRQNNAYYKHYA